MKLKCNRCNENYNVAWTQAVGVFFKREKWNCETCTEIMEYENDFSGPASFCGTTSCNIKRYNKKVYQWMESKIGTYCAVRLKNEERFTGYIESFNKGRVSFLISRIKREFLIMDVDMIELINEGDTKYEDVNNVVYGYKGLYIRKGLLYGRDHIYEIGVPYIEEQKDPFMTDYQDVYSHFCISIEDVFKWRNCMTTSVYNGERNTISDECRIFNVRAEEHCFENTAGGWVTNKLTVLSEVTQNELIAYFDTHEEIREQVIAKLEKEAKMFDLWNRYKNVIIKPYTNELSDNDIVEICVRNAPLYGTERCGAIDDYSQCFQCNAFEFCFGQYCNTSFLYLNLRKRIFEGKFSINCKEYNSLVLSGESEKIESIHRLLQYVCE